MNRPTCKKCNIKMSLGVALVNPFVYSDDFGNDAGQYGTTYSISQTDAEMKKVWKCKQCGYSKELVKDVT